MTHTYAILSISLRAYDEIRAKLQAAGYRLAGRGEPIDMSGLAVEPEKNHPQDVGATRE